MNRLKRFKGSYFSYFLMYNFYYLSWALFSVLISVYLLDKGYMPSEVSLVVSISFFMSMIVQPAIGVLSDKFNSKNVNIILFVLAIIGGIYFIFASSLLEIAIGYSLVLAIINGTNPIMEKVATTSQYQYGKIRVWGTIGYALGSQLAGLLYDLVSPQAIFYFFIITMLITILGLMGTDAVENGEYKEKDKKQVIKAGGYGNELFKNKKYLYYMLIAGLFFGVTNIGHTYISSMLQGEKIQVSLVSTILSIAVIVEAPIVFLSYKFMDKMASKKLLIIAFVGVIMQYAIYGFDFWMPLKIVATLLFKHPPGMLFIMINLKVVNSLVSAEYQITALALVQTFRNLSSIVFQNMAGYILDYTSYQDLFLIALGVMLFGLLLVLNFKLPKGIDKKLFT